MKSFFALTLFLATTAFAQTHTGTLSCFVESEGQVLRTSVEISQNSDGTGGVATAQVEGFGIRCSGSGLSKFGMTEVLSLALTTPAGDEISAPSANQNSALLIYNKSVRCACTVEAK